MPKSNEDRRGSEAYPLTIPPTPAVDSEAILPSPALGKEEKGVEAEEGVVEIAIKMGIPHGGWIPKGRKTGDGVLPGKMLGLQIPLLTIYGQYETEELCTYVKPKA